MKHKPRKRSSLDRKLDAMNASEMVGHMGCDSRTPLQTVSWDPFQLCTYPRVGRGRVIITIW